MSPVKKHNWRTSFTSLAIVLGVHSAIVWGIIQIPAMATKTEMKPAPIMVSLIPAPVVTQPQFNTPKPEVKLAPVKPKKITPVAQPVKEVPSPIAQNISVEAKPSIASVPTPPEAPVSKDIPPPSLPVAPPRFNAAYLDNAAPSYPPLSRRLEEQGKVLLHVYVAMDGHAEKVELKASSGFSRLDNAATEAVRRWRFIPAKQGDQPVAGWVLVPIDFRLDS